MRYEKGLYEAKCPFFLNERGKKIKCEGVCDGACNVIEFNSERGKNKYISKFCCNYPNRCLYADTLEKKYKK